MVGWRAAQFTGTHAILYDFRQGNSGLMSGPHRPHAACSWNPKGVPELLVLATAAEAPGSLLRAHLGRADRAPRARSTTQAASRVSQPGNPSESDFIPFATAPLHKCDSPAWDRGGAAGARDWALRRHCVRRSGARIESHMAGLPVSRARQNCLCHCCGPSSTPSERGGPGRLIAAAPTCLCVGAQPSAIAGFCGSRLPRNAPLAGD